MANSENKLYSIKIYPAAEQDLLDIIDYLNTLSTTVALKYYDLLIEKILTLSTLPERCPCPRDLALKANGYRYLIVENYLVFFKIEQDTVQIHRIIFSTRNYQFLL